VPDLVDMVVVLVSFPSEVDFVQESLSILWNHIICTMSPLVHDTNPSRLVLLATPWHHAMTMVS
jgi:hypothetical protein